MTEPSIIGSTLEEGMVPGAVRDLNDRSNYERAMDWVLTHLPDDPSLNNWSEDRLREEIEKHAEYLGEQRA